jgi:arginase
MFPIQLQEERHLLFLPKKIKDMKIQIIKNRSDIGAGTRGSDMGIDAMEIAAINQNNDFFNRHEFVDVKTHNESIYHKNTNTFAKRIEHVQQQCQRVCNAVTKSMQDGFFPIVLSGDHSSALGTISGIKAAFPHKTLGVIWIDAHADLHSPYTSPSGNIHGMPIAAAMNMDNVSDKMNDPEASTLHQWNQIKNLGIDGPKFSPDHLIYFGLRDFEPAEQNIINQFSIKAYKVEEVRLRGFTFCVHEALEKLKNCDHIYISFDVDSMDCDQISYGTGTPVPVGFTPEEVMNIMEQLILAQKVSCIEFAEINPLLDNKGNKMAETAFQVLDFVAEKLNLV